jgi:hypothetical protein
MHLNASELLAMVRKMLGQKGRAYSRSTNDQVLWRAWTSAIQRISRATKSDFVSAAASAVPVACTARLSNMIKPSIQGVIT